MRLRHVVGLLTLVACAGAQLANEESAANYEKMQLECIDSAQTKAEADKCRCDVKQAYHRPCDGGAP